MKKGVSQSQFFHSLLFSRQPSHRVFVSFIRHNRQITIGRLFGCIHNLAIHHAIFAIFSVTTLMSSAHAPEAIRLTGILSKQRTNEKLQMM
jgi:hypothetical protein